MLTGRDRALRDLIYLLRVIDSSQAARLFFSQHRNAEQLARRRLAAIERDSEDIHHTAKSPWNGRQIYFSGRQTQLEHKWLVSELYVRLHSFGEVLEFQPEYRIGSAQADAYAAVDRGGKVLPILVEVQIGHGEVDLGKYATVHANRQSWPWPVFPVVVVVSPRRFKTPGNIRVVYLRPDLAGMEEIWQKPG